jgi:sterol desaturase/sphingolipid hydroxylase (fatty acid hydroxylase superfamily)
MPASAFAAAPCPLRVACRRAIQPVELRRAAWILGAPPFAVAIYRLLGSLNSVVEHANIRVPHWLDRLIVLIWVSPHMHKVHHSRERTETDSNYANLFSFFDRIFGSYTPSSRGTSVATASMATMPRTRTPFPNS